MKKFSQYALSISHHKLHYAVRIKHFALLFICAATILLTGCGENPAANSANGTEKFSVTEEKNLDAIKISINGQTLTATLEDNATARAFAEKLPLEVDMTEHNGQEKYFYLKEKLPSNPERVDKIYAGDLMLFGDNCVVIFYRNFSTGYSYTRLGKINSDDLAKILGDGNVRVTFER